jgi:predicted oxidoreductase
MKKYPLSEYVENSSPLVFGCMNLGGGWNDNPINKADIAQTHAVIDAALESGIRVFDHADIYARSKAEQVFGKVLKERPELRSSMVLQSKCGIRFEEGIAPKRYDFSGAWISQSVEQTLERLQIDTLDIMMLHRPDALMEPDEIAEVFNQLQRSGKVRYFGVSNMQQHQMRYLQSALTQPLVVNQLELSLSHLNWLEEGMTSGCSGESVTNFSAGTLEYCRTNNVQIQAWGSLSQGLFSGKDLAQASDSVVNTAKLVSQLADELGVSREAVVLAWLMRHPSNIQPVIGTTNPERIRLCAQAQTIQLSREQWYALYVGARGIELP